MMRRLLIFAIAITSFVVLGTTVAHAVDLQPTTFKDFYLQSRITHYDRNATDNPECQPSSPLAAGGGTTGSGVNAPVSVGSTNVETAYDFFVGRGLTSYQAAGIVGNLIAESNLNPTVENSIGAYGIAQWLGGRKTNLQQKANYDTLAVQLNFIWEELTGPYSGVLSSLRASQDVGQATRIILERYEIPCLPGRACDPFYNTRLPMAQGVLDQYGASTPTPAPSPEPSATPTATDANGCPVPQPTVSAGGGGSSGGGGSAPTTGNQPGNLSDSNQACPTGTVDEGTITTKYDGSLVSSAFPTIRLCRLTSIANATVNAAVAAQFQQLGEAAKAAGRSLRAESSFRLENTSSFSGSCNSTQPGVRCAPDGKSTHQLGVAIDFSISPRNTGGQTCATRATSSDPNWIWLRDNASQFGIRQYAYESWHWDILNNSTRC